MSCPFADLGLADTASPAEVKAAWREQAMRLHPDVGGDPEEFHLRMQSYRAALNEAESRPCATCKGKGYTETTAGWSVVQLPCPDC